MKHARLSPSGASKWINCPPSLLAEESFKAETSIYAEEGTFAHDFAEFLLTCYFQEEEILQNGLMKISQKEEKELMQKFKDNSFYSIELHEYVQSYVNFCIEKFNEFFDANIYIEKRYSLEPVLKESFGTSDFTIIGENKIVVIDLKFGKGVKVEAKNNPQLLLYALGAFLTYKEAKTVETYVFQPRLDHVSNYVYSAEEVKQFAIEAKKASELALKGEGERKAGNHCKFCKAKVNCRAFSEETLKAAKLDFKDPEILSLDELAEAFKTAKKLNDWLDKVKAYLTAKALRGEKIPGLKLVHGRSSSSWKLDQKDLISAFLASGYEREDFLNEKIKSITDLKKAFGKKDFIYLFGELIEKKPGAPTLVDQEDRRPEYNSVKVDFGE